jgi:hypothetical protein
MTKWVTGFLTGVLQSHARQTRTAIDTLVFRTEVMTIDETQITAPPATGVCIRCILHPLSVPPCFFALTGL